MSQSKYAEFKLPAPHFYSKQATDYGSQIAIHSRLPLPPIPCSAAPIGDIRLKVMVL